jgi:hypothetical protein
MFLVARYWFRPRALSIGDASNQGLSIQRNKYEHRKYNLGQRGDFTGPFSRALSAGSALVVNGTLDLNGFSSEVGSLAGTGVLTNLATGAPAILTAGANDADSFLVTWPSMETRPWD